MDVRTYMRLFVFGEDYGSILRRLACSSLAFACHNCVELEFLSHSMQICMFPCICGKMSSMSMRPPKQSDLAQGVI